MRQQCPKCGKGFDSGRGLRMHLREKHYGYYFTRFTAPWLVVAALIAVGVAASIPYLATPMSVNTPSDREGLLSIYLTGHENVAMHIHQRLKILVDGVEVKVPANIGITPDGRMRVIHTHDETGVIHVESPRYAEFTFGDFLKIWGKSLNSTCFDRYCGKIRFTANGVEVIDPLNYVLRDRDELVLKVITKPS
jgi:hypothetical protein